MLNKRLVNLNMSARILNPYLNEPHIGVKMAVDLDSSEVCRGELDLNHNRLAQREPISGP